MSKIKFRAWHTLTKTWIENPNIDQNGKPFKCDIFGTIYDLDYAIVNQFIGRTDKHSKEIYEGDIVRVPDGFSGDYYYEEVIGIVEWEEHSCSFLVTNSQDEYEIVHQEVHWEDLEVLGNIYENIDLLKPIQEDIVSDTVREKYMTDEELTAFKVLDTVEFYKYTPEDIRRVNEQMCKGKQQ